MSISRTFTVEKDTKSAVRFAEDPGDHAEAMTTAYLRKAVLTEANDLADAKKIKITVEKIA